MNILVMGGTYFVGRHIVTQLLDLNHNITLFNRNTKGEIFNNVKIVEGDRNTQQLDKLDNQVYDCIIDVSCYNIQQIKTILLKNITNYYVFVSSNAVLNPVDNYSKDKLECEQFLLKQNIESLVVRPFYLCGPYDYTNRYDYSNWPFVMDNKNNHIDYDNVITFAKQLCKCIEQKQQGVLDRFFQVV